MQGSIVNDIQKRTDKPVGRVDATPTTEWQRRVPRCGALTGTTWQGFPAGAIGAGVMETL